MALSSTIRTLRSRDITDAIPFNVGQPSYVSDIWTNTTVAYDVAIGGLPFFYGISNERPYERQTAPYKKEQFDNSKEPGEQTLEGWWIRSQSSFHNGTGIKFYDPSAGETVAHRFTDSDNVDVWTKGQVTLLKETANLSGVTSGIYKSLSIVDGSTDKLLGWIPASTTIKNYTPNGTAVEYTHVTGIGTPLDTAILDIATDGINLFIADSDHIYTGPISTPAAGYSRYYATNSEKVILGWVKQRLVACVGPSVYELTNAKGSDHALGPASYTHPNADWTWTSISEGGSAIYVAGYAGTSGAIYKFTLSTAGVMPTLTQGIIAAQLPNGEYPHKIESYLGYLLIGTNKGVRVATISDTNGDLTYGPLIIEAANTGLDFAFRDRFVYVTGSINGYAGLYRIDLSNEIQTSNEIETLRTLRFAYAKDTYLDGATGYATTVNFVGNSDQIAFTTSGSNGIAIQSTSVLATTGSITTGYIRYGTLEPKNFKRVRCRGDYDTGGLLISPVGPDNTVYETAIYNSVIGTPEVNIINPPGSQEFIAMKFTLSKYKDPTDTSSTLDTTGPTFKGYQVRALPATPRQHLIQLPLYCYDVETDRYNVQVGYDGRSWERLQALEDLESTGDEVIFQDFTTGEQITVVIDSVGFQRATPPSGGFSGFGGNLTVIVREVG